MTNEEASNILKGAIKKPNTKDGYLGQAIIMGVNSLEAWEKVKAEIKEHTKRYSLSSEQNALGTVLWSKYMISFDDVIAIIDKHLQEVTADADSD